MARPDRNNRSAVIRVLSQHCGRWQAESVLTAARKARVIPVGRGGASIPLTPAQMAAVVAVYMLRMAGVARSMNCAAALLPDQGELVAAILRGIVHGRAVTFSWGRPDADIRRTVTLPAALFIDLGRLAGVLERETDAA